MFANELFCNPIHSYSELFKMICNMKHDLEINIAKQIIINSPIYKTIVKDIKLKVCVEWDCWGSIEDYNCNIRYRFTNINGHNFYFSYKENGVSKEYNFSFHNGYQSSFKDVFFNNLKTHHKLKPFFINSVLIGKRKHFTIM